MFAEDFQPELSCSPGILSRVGLLAAGLWKTPTSKQANSGKSREIRNKLWTTVISLVVDDLSSSYEEMPHSHRVAVRTALPCNLAEIKGNSPRRLGHGLPFRIQNKGNQGTSWFKLAEAYDSHWIGSLAAHRCFMHST